MSATNKNIVRGSEPQKDVREKRELRKHTCPITPTREYSAEEIKKIRVGLGMSQTIFAGFIGVSKKAVEAWEAGRNMPDGPARRILAMVQVDPQLPERYNIIGK